MLTSLIITLLAAHLTTSAPTPNGGYPTCPIVQEVATFDDIPGSALSVNNPPPTPYRGLYFQGFSVQTVPTGTAPVGVNPHSGTNYGDITAESQTLQGTAMLTTNYPNPNTTSFTLQDFYFGAVLSLQNAEAALPAPVNMQITGYQGNDNQVSAAKQICSHQFQYNPSTMTGAQELAFSGSIYDCKDLQFLIITFSPVGGQSALSADIHLILDDVRFLAKSNQKGCY